jgi:putative spermidine/putrescine transport system ATP-binding protein
MLKYGSFTAVDTVSLSIGRGEILSLLGPSGCGKTSLLKVIAGLLTPSAGRVWIGGADVTKVLPHQRNVGFLFQSYALFPHLTVEQNLSFGLKVRKVPRSGWERLIAPMLDVFQISHLRHALPKQLSGGQQQRVALARTLVVQPSILLLDEPLSALDRQLRESARIEIRRIVKDIGITTVVVTHDQEEALGLSDRIAVMNEGKLQQLGTPEDIYRRPANSFVGSFIGRANLLTSVVEHADANRVRLRMTHSDGQMETAAARLRRPDGTVRVGDAVSLMIRPEDIRLAATDERAAEGESALPATFLAATFLGDHHLVEVKLNDGTIFLAKGAQHLAGTRLAGLRKGNAVTIAWPSEAVIFFP